MTRQVGEFGVKNITKIVERFLDTLYFICDIEFTQLYFGLTRLSYMQKKEANALTSQNVRIMKIENLKQKHFLMKGKYMAPCSTNVINELFKKF